MSNGYILFFDMNWCAVLIEKEGVGLIQIPYHTHKLKVIFVLCIYHKNEKGKPSRKDLPLLEKRYHAIFKAMFTASYFLS